MAEGALRELLVSFGVEVDDRELQEFEGGLQGLLEKVTHVGHAVAGMFAFHEAKEFIEGTVRQATELEHLSQRLGIGTDELQKFQFAASLAGVGAESAGHSLQLLNRQIGEAVQGGGEGSKTFAKLGISLKDNDGNVRGAGDVVLDLADKFHDMGSAQERTATAMKLFGRQGAQLAPLLAGGREELQKTYKEFEGLGGLMSEDFIKQAKEAEEGTIKMGVAFQGLRIRAVNALLPGFLKFVGVLQDFAKTVQGVVDHSHAFAHALDFIKILAVVKGVQMLVSGMRALAAAESLADLASPFTLMVIAIGLAYLAFDDLMTFMEGGKSVIGDALSPEAAEELRQALADLVDLWPDLKNGASAFLDVLIEGLKGAYKIVLGLGEGIASVIEGAKGLLTGDEEAKDKARAGFRDMVAQFEGAFEPAGEDKARTFSGAHVVRQPTTVARDVQTAEGPPSIGQTIGDINVTVQTGPTTTPEQAGKAAGTGVRKELDRHLLNALNAGKRK